MIETKDAVRYHRNKMFFWLRAQKAAKKRLDKNKEQQAIREYRNHRDALLAIWATPAERLAVSV
ncbi:hypothetical protein MKX41_10685 [Paenibacillus sp. FSL R5-0475]|uniref:hypothetical protein n=1 Tax=Paenibacillus sp. FSL R5-0475 TaxID=2921643 RepID=UPI0030F4D5E1